jgi:UDP-N-acetylglucosamine diphosphorylase/glucosamine-1-phosphate N-acetyltransferase
VTNLFLYDDARSRTFEPFALTRPVSELRAGVSLVRRRWEHALSATARGSIAAAHLAGFDEPGSPPVWQESVPSGSIIANSRCVAAVGEAADADVWTCGGRVAAVRVSRSVAAEELAGGLADLDSLASPAARRAELAGRWLDEVWSVIVDLLPQLRDDILAIGPRLDCVTPRADVLGDHGVFVEAGATIEPHVVLDVLAGPILVRSGATIRAFTRLIGPCAISRGATVLGDRVHGCSIGEGSIVRGEISECIVLGNANKTHDGFVGHSYLGRWVNLGAGTITSNLKNTYGTVSLWTPGGMRDTGVLKLGTMFGDHVKTGIGLRLTTGSVIGAGSNVYGSDMPPKYVPPFSWGEGDDLREYRLEKFLETAERSMSRRQQTLGAGARRQLTQAYARSRSAGVEQ